MICNRESLIEAAPIKGMFREKRCSSGVSHGLTECGYDIRIKQSLWMFPGRSFALASSMEEFDMPDNLMGLVLNKSSWARRKVDASRTTNIEPGWKGFLTIELKYDGWKPLFIEAGSGICQVVFLELKNPARYSGKYQNQGDRPVPFIAM